MKKIILLLFCICFALISKSQLFQNSYGGDSAHTVGTRVFATPDSGYYLFASRDCGIDGTLQITKTNQFGDSLWSKFISVHNCWTSNFCQTLDQGFAIVSYEADTVIITKIDSLCNIQSSISYIDTNAYRPTHILQTNDSAYLIAGYIYKSYSPFPSYIYVTKIGLGGNLLWTKQMLYYTDSGEYPVGLIETSDDFYVIAIYQQSGDNSPGWKKLIKLNNAGDTLWTKSSYGFYQSLNNTINGVFPLAESINGYLIIGNTAGHSWDTGDCIVLKFDTVGNSAGSTVFKGPAYSCFSRAISGGFYLTGATPDTLNPNKSKLIITHVDDNIDSLSSMAFGIPGYSTNGSYVNQFPNGNIAAVGTLDSIHTNYLPTSIFFVVCDTAGNISASIENSPIEINQLQISPNPTSGKLTISNIKSPIHEIDLFNLIGEKVPAAFDCQLRTVDCSFLPPGIYILQASSEGKIWHGKVVKE